MLPRKVRFDPAWKEFVTLRAMRISDGPLQAGDRFPSEVASTRRLRQLYEANRIWPKGVFHPVYVKDGQPAEHVDRRRVRMVVPAPAAAVDDYNAMVIKARSLGLTGRNPPKAKLVEFLQQSAA